jgi:hypothetical protein
MTLPPNPLAWLTFALVWPEWKVLRLGTPRGNAVRDAMLALPPGEIDVLAELGQKREQKKLHQKIQFFIFTSPTRRFSPQ